MKLTAHPWKSMVRRCFFWSKNPYFWCFRNPPTHHLQVFFLFRSHHVFAFHWPPLTRWVDLGGKQGSWFSGDVWQLPWNLFRRQNRGSVGTSRGINKLYGIWEKLKNFAAFLGRCLGPNFTMAILLSKYVSCHSSHNTKNLLRSHTEGIETSRWSRGYRGTCPRGQDAALTPWEVPKWCLIK